MTSIGKFMVAGAAATQESTFALANINFDFSLVKMEAPLEYRGLGSALSSKRKRDAEEGSTHVTARKLGALFADELPHTPNLSRAYGLRVSEIAENLRFNPRGSYRDGPFVDNVGADGTSIWAAATSGRGALAVHLLACLLARIWPSSEAISIWSEIVAARKSLLQIRVQGQEFHLGMVTACQVDIERDRLAEWDASARSWLQTGDSAMQLQQTQLMLIVDNIGLPAPSKATVYDEVMDIWIKAMVMADRLIGGMAQSVQNADDLLGLCAWHIYPDIHAIGVKATTIEQKDTLVDSGGLLTIGLRNAGYAGPTGVSWSMPLAHLRFYGKPVVSQASIGSTSSRVPFDRGMHVILGALTSEWPSSHVDLVKLARFLVLFADALRAGVKSILEDENPMPESLHQELSNMRRLAEKHPTLSNFESTTYWPSLLSLQAQTYLHSNEIVQRETARFFALGRRRYGNALGNTEEHPSPHFGLSHTGLYIQLTAPDRRVSKLREMARMFDDQQALNGAIIRVTHPKDSMGYQMTEFATLFPQNIEGTSGKAHRRWIVFPDLDDRDLGHSHGPFTGRQFNAIKRSIAIMRHHREPCGLLASNSLAITSSEDRHAWQESIHDASSLSPSYPLEFTWLNQSTPLSISSLMEQTVWADHTLPAKHKAKGWQIGHSEHTYGDKKYYYLYGDNTRAAVYQSALEVVSRRSDYALPADYIIRALENGDLDSLRFVNHFVPRFHPHLVDLNISAYFRSLISLAYADKIFTNLPQAEINLNVFAKTLCASKWAKALLIENGQEFGTAVSLACVSLFDTGYIDLQVEDLKDVLAISSANSIYASTFLFCDPGHRPPGHHLRHVIGNVGKPGLALLLSSRDTILREPDLETWQLVNHARFDGCFDDNFSSTTLHLSLTGYEQRLNTSRYGCRDKEAFYLEAVVSAYDRGTWAADLDLLHLVHGPFVRIDASCGHDSHTRSDSSIFPGLTSIDNWHEFRASGNWVARLAFAAIPLANKEALIIASETICWRCLMDKSLERGPSVLEERLILC